MTDQPTDLPAAWEPALLQLLSSLDDLVAQPDAIEFVTAVADVNRNVYVQFTFIADGTLVSEATGDAYLEPAGSLTPGQRAAIARLGWRGPAGGPESGNFWRNWVPPINVEAIAAIAIRTLIEGYGCAAPTALDIRNG